MKRRLDHLGLATRDLERSRRVYERMGFTLSPRSVHSGSADLNGAITPWGSGNHLAMLQDGYFELLGLVDETLPSNVKRMVEKYEGLHVLALRCASAEQTYAELRTAGVSARAPMNLERDALFGLDGEQTRRARFRNIYLDEAIFPEARYILIEHRTPEVMWQPHLMQHPNGAQALAGAYLVVDDLGEAAQRFGPVFGKPAACAAGLEFDAERGKLWVCTQDRLCALSPVLAHTTVHPFAAAAIRVASLDALRSVLKQGGIRFVNDRTMNGDQECVWIGAEDGDHGVIQFV
jgi:catechol 2,3-dioxygenase-like lactoylglutathione lyase family enzyme